VRLDLKTELFSSPENHAWLASAHGVDVGDPITLDGATFLAAFPTGIIPSGVVVGKVTATGLYRAYLTGAVDGSQTALGHLLTTIDLGGTTAGTVGNTGAALYWHGEVVEAKLPTGHGLDAGAKTALKQVRYV